MKLMHLNGGLKWIKFRAFSLTSILKAAHITGMITQKKIITFSIISTININISIIADWVVFLGLDFSICFCIVYFNKEWLIYVKCGHF